MFISYDKFYMFVLCVSFVLCVLKASFLNPETHFVTVYR